MASPTFAELLGRTGLLSAAELSELKDAHVHTGRPYWELAVDQGYCDEGPLFDAIAKASGVPRLNLRLVRVDRTASTKFDEGWANEHHIAPLWADPHRGTLAVAVVDPCREGALRALSARLGLEVRREVGTPSEVRELIRHQFLREPLDRDPDRVNRRAEDMGVDASALVEDERASPSWEALLSPHLDAGLEHGLDAGLEDGLMKADEPGLEGLYIGPARTEPPRPSPTPAPARTEPPRRPPTPAPLPSLDELGALGLTRAPGPGAADLGSPVAARAVSQSRDEALTVRHVAEAAPPRLPPSRSPSPPPQARRGFDPRFPGAFSLLPDAPEPPRAPPPRPAPVPKSAPAPHSAPAAVPQTPPAPKSAPAAVPDFTSDLELPAPPPRLVAPPTPEPLPAPLPGPSGSEPDAPFARLPPNHGRSPQSNLGPAEALPPLSPVQEEDEQAMELELELEDDPPSPTPLPEPARFSPSASAAPRPAPPPRAPPPVNRAEDEEQEAIRHLLPIFEANQETARALKAVFELCMARGIITREEYLSRLRSAPD